MTAAWQPVDGWWRPAVEIVVLWVLYYRLLRVLQRTRAFQVLLALAVLSFVFVATQWLALDHLHWILSKVFGLSLLAAVIIFQPELRRALARLVEGRTWGQQVLVEERIIDELIRAVTAFVNKRTGALIALERDVSLAAYVESGVALGSPVSAELLQTLFTPGAPLHDGAVIIRDNQVAAAGCLFPLSDNPRLAKTYGTRHRAAMGLTEESDALVIVVSEETGAISASIGGRLTRELDPAELRELLEQAKLSQPIELGERLRALS